MKKLFIIIFLMLILSSCSKQTNMNYDVFFERLNQDSIITDKIINDNTVICFTSDGFVLQLKNNSHGDIYNVSLTCKDLNKTDEFILFFESVLDVYAPEENADNIINELTCKDVVHTYQSEWYSYQFVKTEAGMFLSVNNNKLKPESIPEFSLKQNEKIENKKTH